MDVPVYDSLKNSYIIFHLLVLAVVLVLSDAFLGKSDPMNELVSVMERRKQQKAAAAAAAGSDGDAATAPAGRQQILPVYFDISFSDCGQAAEASGSYFKARGFDDAAATAYASALSDLRSIGSRRIDQVKFSVDQVNKAAHGASQFAMLNFARSKLLTRTQTDACTWPQCSYYIQLA